MQKPSYDVMKAYRDDEFGDVVYHEVKAVADDGTPGHTVHKYSAVKAGLSWPTNESPGYYVIMAQHWDGRFKRIDSVRKRYGLEFMADHEQQGMGSKAFMDKLTDDCVRYACDTVYTSITEEREQEYADMFRDYLNQHPSWTKDLSLTLDQAPFSDADNFILGVQIITDMDQAGKIRIPKECEAYRQLLLIGENVIGEKPNIQFWALNALRYVIGAYHKFDFAPMWIEPAKARHWMEA